MLLYLEVSDWWGRGLALCHGPVTLWLWLSGVHVSLHKLRQPLLPLPDGWGKALSGEIPEAPFEARAGEDSGLWTSPGVAGLHYRFCGISLKTRNPSLIAKSHAKLDINSVSFPLCSVVAKLACPKQKQRKRNVITSKQLLIMLLTYDNSVIVSAATSVCWALAMYQTRC